MWLAFFDEVEGDKRKHHLLVREEDDEGGREGEDGGDVEGDVHVLLPEIRRPTEPSTLSLRSGNL